MKIWNPVWQMECNSCGTFCVAKMQYRLHKNDIDKTDRIRLCEIASCGRCFAYIQERNTLIQRSEVPEELKLDITNI